MPRPLLPLALLFAFAAPVFGQNAPAVVPIRAWIGPAIMFSTDLANGIGAGYDLHVTIERPDVVGVSVVLGGYEGTTEARTSTSAGYGAFLAGRSFPVAADAFVYLAAGIGYAQTDRTLPNMSCDLYGCYGGPTETTIGAIVPVRAELHVPYRRDRSFGIVAQATLFGDTPNRLGLGLHYAFGRNL